MGQMIVIGLLIIAVAIAGCATQTQQLVGNDRDVHGCIGSAGYSWCEIKQKCLRSWEENCTNETQAQPGSTLPSGNLGIKKDVAISGFAFDPSAVTIPSGATVIWTNKDSATHTIVSDRGNEISSGAVSQGESYAHTFNAPGSYPYHCGIHPSMKGTIVVE
jgi:plastocyanin